jgi:ABC-type bacteriocin/lantibiotic exporter with double-glycine peptidase domain
MSAEKKRLLLIICSILAWTLVVLSITVIGIFGRVILPSDEFYNPSFQELINIFSSLNVNQTFDVIIVFALTVLNVFLALVMIVLTLLLVFINNPKLKAIMLTVSTVMGLAFIASMVIIIMINNSDRPQAISFSWGYFLAFGVTIIANMGLVLTNKPETKKPIENDSEKTD